MPFPLDTVALDAAIDAGDQLQAARIAAAKCGFHSEQMDLWFEAAKACFATGDIPGGIARMEAFSEHSTAADYFRDVAALYFAR